MAKPTKHGTKWRIRWLDDRGQRQSAVFDDYKRAQTELRQRQVEAEEIRRGIRNAPPPEKTFGDLLRLLDREAHDEVDVARKPHLGANGHSEAADQSEAPPTARELTADRGES